MFSIKRIGTILKDDLKTVMFCSLSLLLLFMIMIFVSNLGNKLVVGTFGTKSEKLKITDYKEYDDIQKANIDLKENKINVLIDNNHNTIYINENFKSFEKLKNVINNEKFEIIETKNININSINSLIIYLSIFYILMMFLIAPILFLREKTYGVDKYIFYSKLTSTEYLTAKFLGILIPNILFPFLMSLATRTQINGYFNYAIISTIVAFFITSFAAIVTLKFKSSNDYVLVSTVITTSFMVGLLVAIGEKLILYKIPIIKEFFETMTFGYVDYKSLSIYMLVSIVLMFIYGKNYRKGI